MALWNGLGQAATLAQLAGVDAGGLISMIIHSAQTVKQNKEECRQLVQDVMVISPFVQEFQRLQMMRFPVIRVVLGGLQDTLRQVHELVTSSQKRNIMYSFCMAGNQAQKFRDVRDRINFHLQLYPMISHMHLTYLLCGIYSRLDPSGIQPQALKEVLESFASHPNPYSTSAVNSEITTSATGSEVPCAPLSGITEFTLSTLVATTQHFPKESITEGGGHSQVTMVLHSGEARSRMRGVHNFSTTLFVPTKPKNVIKIQMTGMGIISLARDFLATKLNGVSSLVITEDGREMLATGDLFNPVFLEICCRKLGPAQILLEVFCHGVDPVCVVSCLRRELEPAQILQVEEVEDKELQPVVMNTEEARPADKGGFRATLTKLSKFMWPRARRSVSPPPPSPLRVEHTDNPAPAASGGPSSHLFSVPSTSTAVSAASPPACTQEQRNPSASAQRQDLSRAADLPPVTVAQARRRQRTFNMSSRVRLSARSAAAPRQQTTTQQAQGNVSSSNAGGTDDELAAVEAGCVLQEYMAMFDGPMPPAVIAALAGAVFHLDGEGGIHMSNA